MFRMENAMPNVGSSSSGTPVAPYLVSIDHVASPSVLLKIDVATGVSKVACTLPNEFDSFNYHSSTFSRTGTLFASNHHQKRIDKIDPCSCQVTPLGPTGGASIPGLTVNHSTGLFGVDVYHDVLVHVDTTTGAATNIGALGVDFMNSGATWSDSLNADGGLYAINAPTNSLYSINPETGHATLLTYINGLEFGSVGIEMHPANDTIYACTNGENAILHAIDPITGTATGIGTGMGHAGDCNNLAAPWLPIACLDAL